MSTIKTFLKPIGILLVILGNLIPWWCGGLVGCIQGIRFESISIFPADPDLRVIILMGIAFAALLLDNMGLLGLAKNRKVVWCVIGCILIAFMFLAVLNQWCLVCFDCAIFALSGLTVWFVVGPNAWFALPGNLIVGTTVMLGLASVLRIANLLLKPMIGIDWERTTRLQLGLPIIFAGSFLILISQRWKEPSLNKFV